SGQAIYDRFGVELVNNLGSLTRTRFVSPVLLRLNTTGETFYLTPEGVYLASVGRLCATVRPGGRLWRALGPMTWQGGGERPDDRGDPSDELPPTVFGEEIQDRRCRAGTPLVIVAENRGEFAAKNAILRAMNKRTSQGASQCFEKLLGSVNTNKAAGFSAPSEPSVDYIEWITDAADDAGRPGKHFLLGVPIFIEFPFSGPCGHEMDETAVRIKSLETGARVQTFSRGIYRTMPSGRVMRDVAENDESEEALAQQQLQRVADIRIAQHPHLVRTNRQGDPVYDRNFVFCDLPGFDTVSEGTGGERVYTGRLPLSMIARAILQQHQIIAESGPVLTLQLTFDTRFRVTPDGAAASVHAFNVL
ncbi:MAG: hypothetical protein KIT58_02245, partial [Planctomycetota bacterium]|nr:hypothetical protein [Planctomycetota bacterium]